MTKKEINITNKEAKYKEQLTKHTIKVLNSLEALRKLKVPDYPNAKSDKEKVVTAIDTCLEAYIEEQKTELFTL